MKHSFRFHQSKHESSFANSKHPLPSKNKAFFFFEKFDTLRNEENILAVEHRIALAEWC